MPDRLAERAELAKLFALEKSVQMLAPRRVGKTWLMGKLVEDLRSEGWTAIYIDLQGMRTTEEFLQKFCSELQARHSAWGLIEKNLKQRVAQLVTDGWTGSAFEAASKIDAKKYSEALIASLNEGGKDAIILLDEIALFVLNLLADENNRAKDFMYHLRGLRQAYPKVRWLFAGSVGLDVVARRHGLQGAQLGMISFLLEPFAATDTREFIARLSQTRAIPRPFVFTDDAFDYFVAELGWLSPFYIELLAYAMKPTGQAASPEGLPVASKEDVERAFDDLLHPHNREQFSAWEEHIVKNFPANETARLSKILELCSANSRGELAETLQSRITGQGPPISMRAVKNMLISLANDGFLQKREERWQFRSGLLRRYWLEYMV